MKDYGYIFCETCQSIQPIFADEILGTADGDASYCGCDLVCNRCKAVIVTLYKKRIPGK